MTRRRVKIPFVQIQLFNSLGRTKQTFEPIELGKVRIYSCGPTVYASPHIGNFRAFIFADLLRRSFEFFGFAVEHVMNITDVGHLTSDGNDGADKLDAAADNMLYLKCKFCGKDTPSFFASTKEAFDTGTWENCAVDCKFCGKENIYNSRNGKGDLFFRNENKKIEKVKPLEIARKYEKEFRADLAKLEIETPTHLPRASEHIAEQIELIRRLEKNGFTYSTSDGIYFDTSKFANYGKLSGQKMDEKTAGARVAVNSEKRNPADFALWKFCVGENAGHILRWTNPSGDGEGFPGWHIECSAMSMKYLGETIDIHTGGVDHIPVHHENEIAQSEAATGKKFVNFWLHNEFLTVDGGKMSKSLGNLFTLSELAEKGFEPLAFRYLCLNSHYRGKLNFTFDALRNAQNSLASLREIFRNLPDGGAEWDPAVEKFSAALADDLNSPRALAEAWSVARNEKIDPAIKKATLARFDAVLALRLGEKPATIEISAEQKKLLGERATARAEQDFARADAIRDQFTEMGFEIEDADGGAILKKKK